MNNSELGLIKTKQRDFAALLLTILFFNEPDLHGGNWGINHAGNIVKIDNDRMFCNFAMDIRGKEVVLGAEDSPSFLDKWPHLVYTLTDAFRIISPEDILSLPEFNDLKPYNHPFRLTEKPGKVFSEFNKTLQKDPVFIQWKFFYCTKYLLLLTPDRIRLMINSHSIAEDSINEAFLTVILERHARIKAVLLTMPDYFLFLKNTMPTLQGDMIREIEEYNHEFFDKKTNRPKSHKQCFLIDPNIICQDLEKLITEAETAIRNDTPEKAMQRAIALDIERLAREITAVKLYDALLKNEAEKFGRAQELKTKPWAKAIVTFLLPQQERLLTNFIDTYKIPHVSSFLKSKPGARVSDLLDHILKYSKEKAVKFPRQKEISRIFIAEKIERLFDDPRKLSSEQLEKIWDAFSETNIQEKIKIGKTIIDNCQFEMVPIKIIRWIVTSIAAIEPEIQALSEQTVFVRLCMLLKAADEKILNLLQEPTHQITFSKRELAIFCEATAPHFFDIREAQSSLESTPPDVDATYILKLQIEKGVFRFSAAKTSVATVAYPVSFPTPHPPTFFQSRKKIREALLGLLPKYFFPKPNL